VLYVHSALLCFARYLLRFTAPCVHFVPATTLPALHQLVPLATARAAYLAIVTRHAYSPLGEYESGGWTG
jgi:hypothetical protein